jgi:hypothetical protein
MATPTSLTSNKAATPAVDATNTSPDGGLAVHGFTEHGHGVEGRLDEIRMTNQPNFDRWRPFE